MNSVRTPIRPSQARTTLAVNSPPLSDLIWSGGPRPTNRSVSACSTSSEVSRRATTMARHSRVYSSMTVSMRKGRPSEVRSCTKS
jgi:hypothetical protein